ncbi:UNVERIFIED_CONTAM: DNA methyltransferase [Euhalothece sp. KZN 001]
MNNPISESNVRKIANQEYNCYIARKKDQHRSTSIAPSSLLKPFSKELKEQLSIQYQSIEATLINLLGQPYYSNQGFILYQGDAQELLQAMSQIEMNLTITSPPYNIGKEYEESKAVDEYIEWCSQWMNQIYNLTHSQGAFWLNVGYLEVPNQGLCVPIPYLLWNKSPFYLLQEVIWKYGAGVSTKHRMSPRNEKWLFYVKDPHQYTFNLDSIRDPNVKYPNQKKNGKYRCNPLGKNPSDVWEFPKVTTGTKRSSKERTAHPAQFPLGIVERVVKASSNQLELVLDPFAGSGSTGIAAVGLGRIFLGFEIRRDYCDIAVKRFEDFIQERENFFDQKELFE